MTAKTCFALLCLTNQGPLGKPNMGNPPIGTDYQMESDTNEMEDTDVEEDSDE